MTTNSIALGKKCNNCGIRNHIAKMCRKTKMKNKTIRNIEKNVGADNQTINNMENYNSAYKSGYNETNNDK